jgi:hypothetical protein
MKTAVFTLVALSSMFCLFSSPLYAGVYGGGSGTGEAPYQISTAAHWQELMATSADWNKQFILTSNINLAGITVTPVGNNSTAFTGVFDGGGHIISNVVINTPGSGSVGLFGYVSGGKIKNLGVMDANIQGSSSVGGLVGQNSGTLTGCYATGSVTGTNSVGGLVGNKGSGVIDSCYATCTVSGNSYVGGLVGLVGAPGGTMSTCYAAGAVSGNNYVGGLVGENYAGTIIACFWDMQTSGQSVNYGIGLPTAAMQNPETYLRAFWDFKGEIANGTEDTWTMPDGGGYPILSWQAGASVLANDEMNGAISINAGASIIATSVGATGLDLTRNGYNDCKDVWYVFTPAADGKYTISVLNSSFDTTLGVFDAIGKEVAFNDDFFGKKSVVILKANVGKPYYLRIAGYDKQTGTFTLTVAEGAIQAIQGDLNYDGNVNLDDLSLMAQNWLVEME